jgi:hypothetical protein
MTIETTVQSEPLPGDTAHELMVEIEHLGIDTSQIAVHARRPVDSDLMSRADTVVVQRPARRVVYGTIYGAVVAGAMALIVATGWSIEAGELMLAAAIVGGALGGLFGLYSRLAMSPDIYDAGTGAPAVVEVSLRDLDRATADRVTELISHAERR